VEQGFFSIYKKPGREKKIKFFAVKTHRDFIHITSKSKEEIINITSQVQKICKNSGISEGMVLVFPHHTSSAVYITDSDTGITSDLLKVLGKTVPAGDDYTHNMADPKKNAAAHLKSTLTGHHIVAPLSGGKLDLGRYQTIYYAEFDGMREKEVLVKITGE
jgi:secondary thiamine-phosphate synthase enzyme